jgi:hypothetical protein
MSKATVRAAAAAGEHALSGIGFMTLETLFKIQEDPKKANELLGYQASSIIPFSSLLGQTASFFDPNMREVKGFIDAVKNRIPGARETLPAKLDVFGRPRENPGFMTIRRSTTAITDPIDMELNSLDIHPGRVQQTLPGGVKLSKEEYDKYQATSGDAERQIIGNLMSRPAWQYMTAEAKKDAIKGAITEARKGARGAVQIKNIDAIRQGILNRRDAINGNANTPKMQYPEINPAPPTSPAPPTPAMPVMPGINYGKPTSPVPPTPTGPPTSVLGTRG